MTFYCFKQSNKSLSYQQFSLRAPLHYLASHKRESDIVSYSRHLFAGGNVAGGYCKEKQNIPHFCDLKV